MNYMIASGRTADSLASAVAVFMKEGFYPSGSVFLAEGIDMDTVRLFYQPMVCNIIEKNPATHTSERIKLGNAEAILATFDPECRMSIEKLDRLNCARQLISEVLEVLK